MVTRRKASLTAIAGLLAAAALALSPGTAAACPLCQDELSDASAWAFSASTLFMLSMPFLLVGFLGIQLARALNPAAFVRATSRIAALLGRRWMYVILGLAALVVAYAALAPAAPAARAMPRERLAGQANLNGGPLEPAMLDDKVVLVNFFASWCEACKAEVAALAELYGELGGRGVEVIGITFDFEHQDVPEVHVHADGIVHYHAQPDALERLMAFLQASGASYAVLANAPENAEAFGGVRAIPATFLYDRRGVLVKRYVGPPPLTALKADVERLLNY